MKLNRGEIIFLSVVFTAITLAGVMLYADFNRRISAGNLTEIGILRLKYKTAQRKYDREVVWEELENNIPIYNRDTIRTAAASEAVIELADGTKIDIGENSMIVLNFSGKAADIDFLYGSIRASQDNSADGAALTIRTDSGAVSLSSGTDVSLAAAEGTPLSLNVTSGQASLIAAGETLALAQNESATLTGGKVNVSQNPIRLNSPEDGARRFISGKLATELFSWETNEPNTVLEISKDASFKRPLISRRVSNSSREQLAAGLYYWRVRVGSVPGEFRYSETRRLGIFAVSNLVAITPANGSVFETVQESAMVNFQFSRNELANGYRLRVSRKADLTEPLINEEIMANSISRALPLGEYYWQVSARLPEGAPSAETPVQRFSVRKAEADIIPTLRSPRQKQSLNAQALASGGFNFNWVGHPNFKEYQLVIANNRNFTEEILREKTTANFLIVRKELKAGVYFWKITAIDDQGREIASEIRTFSVEEAAAIVLLSPADGSSFASYSPIDFLWKTEGYQGSWRLLIARDQEFKDVYLKLFPDKMRYSIALPDPGRYFWRITVGQEDNMLSSETRSLVITEKTYQTTTLLLPEPNSVIDMSRRDSILFRWKKVEDAEYTLTIARQTSGGSVSVFRSILRANEYEFRELKRLDIGKFTWSVQVGSNPENIVTGSFTLELKEKPKSPEIDIPDIIFIE